MRIPAWFWQAIDSRLEEVSAQIELHTDLKRVRAEENEAFQALFPGTDISRMPGFADWEDRHHFKQSIINERLYFQGIKDGAQLAFALMAPSVPSDHEMPFQYKHKKGWEAETKRTEGESEK